MFFPLYSPVAAAFFRLNARVHRGRNIEQEGPAQAPHRRTAHQSSGRRHGYRCRAVTYWQKHSRGDQHRKRACTEKGKAYSNQTST